MVRLPYSGQTGLSPEVVNQARELAKAGKYEEAKQVMEKKLKKLEGQVYLPFLGICFGFCGRINYDADGDSCRYFARFRYNCDRL